MMDRQKPERVRHARETVVQEGSQFLVESWYHKLQEHTFETEFLDLQPSAADAILAHARLTVRPAALRSQELQEKIDIVESELSKLAKQIDEAIQRVGGAAFVRLSSRSPKDAACQRPDMGAVYQDQLARCTYEYPRASEEILEKIAFTRMGSSVLKITSGQTAIDLFVKSMRVRQDLSTARAIYGDDISIKVIVRKWIDLAFEWEFRAFVFGGKMNAITQYYESCFVPSIAARKEEILEFILKFFESIKERIDAPDYTIDFAVSPQLDHAWIVELNNPPPIAGQSMFDWELPEDREIIQDGPLEFRILEQPMDNPWAEHAVWFQRMKDDLRSKKKAKRRNLGGSM